LIDFDLIFWCLTPLSAIHMTCLMNNLHQVHSKSKDWEAKYFKHLGARKTNNGLNSKVG